MSIGMIRKRERESLEAQRKAVEKIKVEVKIEKFVCSVCGKEYKTEKGLKEHIANKHRDGE